MSFFSKGMELYGYAMCAFLDDNLGHFPIVFGSAKQQQQQNDQMSNSTFMDHSEGLSNLRNITYAHPTTSYAQPDALYSLPSAKPNVADKKVIKRWSVSLSVCRSS